jgi:hypothetical protein
MRSKRVITAHHISACLRLLLLCVTAASTHGFLTLNMAGVDRFLPTRCSCSVSGSNSAKTSTINAVAIDSVEEATRLLSEWDKLYNPESPSEEHEIACEQNLSNRRESLAAAVLLLSNAAAEQRRRDASKGRCMLGVCASSAQEGVGTLKAWVTALQLPRGLLHGMDMDGTPLELNGGVYIKYNSGGVYTFADIRKSGMGFDALWKPGDALLQPYDGTFRGVYFQVELEDEEFRQYLVPLDIF